MALTLSALSDLDTLPFDAVIDVRSPAEFAEDHIPGAINLPVLDNAERARVGTIYTQQSAFRARRIGAALVARNAARHLEGPLADKAKGWRPLVHCWRGGQRSGAFATILCQVGWRVETLAGGYRSYRRLVKAALYDTPVAAPVVVLDGDTGTAKTEILARLARRGHQVIDLEGLANHRGSIFGARAGGQPAQKAFESALAHRLRGFDPARPVLVEAESSKVGRLNVPLALWEAMKAAPRIVVTAPRTARADYTARAYRDILAAPDELRAMIAGLAFRHPKDTIARWQNLAEAGEVETLTVELMAEHYDPLYARQRARLPAPAERISLGALDEVALDAALAKIEVAITRSGGAHR